MSVTGRKNADDAFLKALACGATVEVAAAKAGISVRTAYRRLADAQFQRRLAETKVEMVKRTAATFSAASMEAAKTFVELMGQPHAPAVRLGAARNIVQLGLQLREHTDILEELVELRRMIATPQPSERDPGP
jgi:hypothetical protein